MPTEIDQTASKGRRSRSLYRSVAEALRRRFSEGKLPPGGKLPSLRVLAREFNVSTMTINQAFRMLQDDGLVTYIPSVGAFARQTSPRSQSSTPATIAFVTIELEGAFSSRIASGIAAACRDSRLALQVLDAEARPEIEAENIAHLTASGATGAIVLPTLDASNFEAMFALKVKGFPFVLVDRWIAGLKVDIVESNHERGAYLATEHLLAHGHRGVHMLTCPPGMLSSADARVKGYERALLDHGIEPLREWRVICDSRLTDPDQRFLKWSQAVLPVLKKLKEPAAFVTLNAYAGRGLLEACRTLGLRVPDDVSVVSFDDTEFLQAFDPPVTVIAQRTREIGRTAVELLEKRMRGAAEPEPQHVQIDMDLIQRRSVRAK